MENEQKACSFPPKSIDFWYHTSVGLALVAAAAILPVIYYIFSAAGNSALVDERVKLTTTLGTSLGVLLTFSTVVWRGLVGEAQANEQKRANDAKEEENRSILFHKGLELISQSDTQGTNVAAGITTLEFVASVKASQFSQLSTDALADYIITNIEKNDLIKSVLIANLSLKRGTYLGNRAQRHLTVVGGANNDQTVIPYYGFQNVFYIGGQCAVASLAEALRTESFEFYDVSFFDLRFNNDDATFEHCTFKSCKFKQIHLQDMQFNKYERCDFSGTYFEPSLIEPIENPNNQNIDLDRYLEDCFYYEQNPPTGYHAAYALKFLRKIPASSSPP